MKNGMSQQAYPSEVDSASLGAKKCLLDSHIRWVHTLALGSEKSSSDNPCSLYVAFHTPRDATTLATAQASSRLCDALCKALAPYCL